MLGWHVESAVIAASFASWPVIAQILTKVTLALPFTFHSLNGIRHLVWDTASMVRFGRGRGVVDDGLIGDTDHEQEGCAEWMGKLGKLPGIWMVC